MWVEFKFINILGHLQSAWQQGCCEEKEEIPVFNFLMIEWGQNYANNKSEFMYFGIPSPHLPWMSCRMVGAIKRDRTRTVWDWGGSGQLSLGKCARALLIRLAWTERELTGWARWRMTEGGEWQRHEGRKQLGGVGRWQEVWLKVWLKCNVWGAGSWQEMILGRRTEARWGEGAPAWQGTGTASPQ